MNINKLNTILEDRKISKATVIKKTGLSRPALDAILSGKDFKVSNLEKIAKVLGVPVGYFFDEQAQTKTEIRSAGRDYVEKGKIEHHTPAPAADGAPSVATLLTIIENQNTLIASLQSRLRACEEG